MMTTWFNPAIPVCKIIIPNEGGGGGYWLFNRWAWKSYLILCLPVNKQIPHLLNLQVDIWFLDGIGHTVERAAELQKEPFDIENFQYNLSFTFNIDHAEEMFKKPLVRAVKKFNKSFDFFILNFNDDEWQKFDCPMVFNYCQYNWCASGENPMVSQKVLLFKPILLVTLCTLEWWICGCTWKCGY